MRYYQEFMRACKTTAVVIFVLAMIKVVIPTVLTGSSPVDPVAFFFSTAATTVVCIAFFTLTNIYSTKRRAQREAAMKGQASRTSGKKEL